MKYRLERLPSKEKIEAKTKKCYTEFTFAEQAAKHAEIRPREQVGVCDRTNVKKDTERRT